MESRRAAKCLVALACSLAAIGMASAVGSHMVNYRGQPQEDLTCMQASTTVSGETLVYRNDPSTNCFGFPSIQFDSVPVYGGKPNGITIDWSLMVDELQMQDDDRLHFHLPGFTGAHNTFGIMGSAIDDGVSGQSFTPNFNSLKAAGDLTTPLALRADFGALVGIWGISCGTEKNLYMDRAKVDNLLTAEWDPSREMLKVVIKGQRYANGDIGRHDGYVGTRSDEYAASGSAGTSGHWKLAGSGGLAIPFSASTTDPTVDKTVTYTAPAGADTITMNDQSLRGHHLQAMEYAFEGPRDGTLAQDLVLLNNAAITTAVTNYQNDGYIYAPGNRVCGIYIDPTKLHISQDADEAANGLGPLPPRGGISKNWYKLAYMRRFRNDQCQGGVVRADGKFSRPGMGTETCSMQKDQDLSKFWQVPFDGDTERVVGYRFTTTKQMLPVASGGAVAGKLEVPTFSLARAYGSTTGKGSDNCIFVELVPTVSMMSGSSSTQITIEGLLGSGTSDTDTLDLYWDDSCLKAFSALKGSDGQPIKSFAPVAGTSAHGSASSAQLHTYRPFGRAALNLAGTNVMRQVGTSATTLKGSDGWYDDADWHTRARHGTTTAITTGDPNQDTTTASTLKAAGGMIASKLSSPVGSLTAGNAKAKFEKGPGRLTVNLSPGYFLYAGELLAFGFKLQNGNTVQASQDLTVSASGTYCDSDNHFCDGVADKSLSIDKVKMRTWEILEAADAKFTTKKIYQSSSDPDDLTTLFVTIATNVALKKPDTTSDAKITIKGLCGFETGTDVVLYQNQKSGGMHKDGSWPTEAVRSKNDLPGLSSDDTGIIDHRASFDADGTLKIKLGTTGLAAETDYAFAFQLQTKKMANDACTPTISSSGGSETIPASDMKATNVGLVKEPMFTTIKIGQVTTRPSVTNYLCVTLQHNFKFYSDAVVNQASGSTGNYIESKITISGLKGTAAESTGANDEGIALTYCPTEVPNFDDKTTQHTSTQFQPDTTAFTPKRFATFGTSSCFGDSLATQKCVPGNPNVPDGALDTSVAGRSWFGGRTTGKDRFTWDKATGTAVLTVDADITAERKTEPQTVFGGIPKNSEIVFALPLLNGEEDAGCADVTFEASGRIVQKATFVQTKTGRAIQDGEADGDACALKVYAPGFLVKKMTQSTSSTGEDNTMTVSLRSNVDLASRASGQASYITISGLTGTATGDGDIGVSAPTYRFSPKFEGGEGPWTQSSGTLVLKLDAQGACVPPTVWAAGDFSTDGSSTTRAPFALGGSDTLAASIQSSTTDTTLTDQVQGYKLGGKRGTSMPSNCIKAGYLYVFTFQVTNPSQEQAAPTVMIEAKYRDSQNNEKPIAKKAMDPPISDDDDKTPMFVSDQILTKYKIGQLIPAPGSINVICVTLRSSKDIKSQPDAPLSSITLTGLTGFDASAQDLQLYKNDGVTKVRQAGGNPATDAYDIGGVFSSNNAASESLTTTSGKAWAKYDGSTAGNVVVWIQGDTASDGIYSFMQKNVDHKFCFRLKNPKTEMSCKDVSVIVNNKGTVSSVKANQDTSNSIEYYKFGSTCAGYVAPPNFVIKNWRSSSDTTTNTAIIHMELATNLELGTGDFITVSGLTSYTKSCSSPPCDVGIDVTRTAVSRLHGKPYINGVRNVKGYGLSDTGASASERATFAKAIQSYDLTGANDDGSKTSTFGDDASWGKVGDTEESASTLTFTVAKDAEMLPADISFTISGQTAPSEPVIYEIVFTLNNKPSPVDSAPTISINIGQGQTQYVSLPMNTGQEQPKMGITKVGDGGMEIAYTPMRALYGGESLILTLPKFDRDTNGMLFGVTSSPNDAFETYKTMHDWKAYGTDESYARAFFTNGWVADGISAKSGDSGQTGERWNYPNVNAKVTTDADYSRDTGVLVLDINDPGIGMNKNYWYAATEDNLYEGRVTRAANLGSARSPFTTVAGGTSSYANFDRHQVPLTATGSSASVDYYLDNGEELKPVRAFMWSGEPDNLAGTAVKSNAFKRGGAYMPLSATSPKKGQILDFATTNVYPASIPSTVDAIGDDLVGTPPFKGIPSKFQPSRRDNFYKGMLMKCWVGTAAVGGRLPYTVATTAGQDNYIAKATTRKELLPPPEYNPQATYGDKQTPDSVTASVPLTFAPWSPSSTAADGSTTAAANSYSGVQGTITSNGITNAAIISKADVSRTLETRVIQASYRQIDYVPRKLGGCRFSGTLQKAQVNGVVTVAATDRKNSITYDNPTGNGFLEGQTINTMDGNTNTVKSMSATGLTLNNNLRATVLDNTWIFAHDQPSTLAAVGCQDEVPGYPAVVRLESPFSRPLDPDTLCYIQRKADVGVYTGMTAMVGNKEYLIKQGAANIYTVGHVVSEMTGTNEDPVDRMVPRSYSTENTGVVAGGKRTTAFFSNGAGLSGQPYTIYSQLELVAREGSKVSTGETITITIPKAAGIMPPSNLFSLVTPVEDDFVVVDKIKISHVLLVPLSPACSIVAGYGVASGCQDNNGKGGVFDLILSDRWPYAYTSANENDINGLPMTVFGGQSTVIKTMADKYSQDLPYRPLEGLNTADVPAFTAATTFDVMSTTFNNAANSQTGGRAQTNQGDDGRAATTLKNSLANAVSGSDSANSKVDTTFTVLKELDLLTLTSGTSRADAEKTPKLPNAPITVTDGACGTRVSDTLGPSTLPYAVCLSLDGALAHNQGATPWDSVLNAFLSTGATTALDASAKLKTRTDDNVLLAAAATFNAAVVGGDLSDATVRGPQTLQITVDDDDNADDATATGGNDFTSTMRPGMTLYLKSPTANDAANSAIVTVKSVDSTTQATVTKILPLGTVTVPDNAEVYVVFPGPAQDDNDKIVDGPQKITGEVGQEATPVLPGPINDLYGKMGSMRTPPNYGTMAGTYENPADNLGLGAYIVVGVYTNGTSDKFIYSTMGNKGTTKSAHPVETDMESNLVIQRYLGTSRTAIPLADIPAGLIGGDNANKPEVVNTGAAYPKPAGQVPRYQARVAAGYNIGRFSFGVDNIMQVRSDLTAGAYPTGMGATPGTTALNAWAAGFNRRAPLVVSPVNMDGAVPMSPASMSADLNQDFDKADRLATTIGYETLSPMNRHPSGHSVDVTAPSTMQKIRFGRSTLPLPQVFHTAEHKAGATEQTNRLTRGHCGLEGASGVAANFADATRSGTRLQLAIPVDTTREVCVTRKSTEFNPDLPFSRNVYIEQGMDVFLVSSLFDTLIQRPEPMRKLANGRTEEGRTQLGCGMGTGYYAGGDQSLNKWSSLIETSVAIGTAVVAPAAANSGNLNAPNVFKIALDANGLYDATQETPHNPVKAGDIIYTGAAAATAATVLAGEAMLVKSVDTDDKTLMVERGFLGTTATGHAANNVIFVRKCDGGAFPKATAPPILKRTVARGTHATDDEVLGNIQTSGTRRSRSHSPTGAAPTANSKGQMLDTPIEGGNYNYGFDMDFRLYSVLGPFMRPAVIRDVVDSGKIPTVKTSQFPGVLTIADPYNSANYLPGSSNVPADHGYKLSATVSTDADVGTSVVLSSAADRMNEKGCTAINPCIISAAATAGTLGEEMMEVTSVSNDGKTLTVTRASATTFGMYTVLPAGTALAAPVNVKTGDVVTYYPGWKKISGKTTAAAGPTVTRLTLDAAGDNDELENLALPFYLRIGAEFLKVTQVYGSAAGENGRALTVERGALGSTATTIATTFSIYVVNLPAEDRNNNVKYTLAPVTGTTFAILQNRDTEYRKFQETDRIITFCNPLQSDLNNAPGSVIMSAISDDAVLDPNYTADQDTRQNIHSSGGTIVNSPWTRTSATDTTFASSNGLGSSAPSLWTVPRRHHLCRKLITGAPELSTQDVASDVYATDNGEMYARSRYTESIQMNTVLNQDPSPNMRAMVTFVEPTYISVQLIKPEVPVPETPAPPVPPTETPAPYDNTPAIVGGVLGGFFGLLLIGTCIWYACCRQPPPEPVGRAVAMVDKPLAPVYLPQPYPSLPEQYMPAPMPAYPEVVQTTQPMLYSSYQAAPVMEALPPQPGAYPAPYGVVPQPAYGI